MKLLFRPDRPEDRKMVNNYLDALTEPTWIETKKITKRKSRASEDYYWRCIIRPLAEEIGYSRNEEEKLHSELLYEFSYEWATDLKGAPMRDVVRSTDVRFTTQWQQNYYEGVRQWAADFHNFVIALPNEDLEAPIDEQF
jgi:hypothetical protein